MFTDAFISRTLTSSCFVRPVAKFICSKVEKETHLGENIGKHYQIFHPSLPTSRSVSNSSTDVKIRKLATDMTKKTKKLPENERNSRHKHKKSSSFFSGSLICLSSPASSEGDFVITKTQNVFNGKRLET